MKLLIVDTNVLLLFLELLWVAPELLSRSERKTKPGDVYSYGIILAEILTREDPYAELQMDPRGFTNYITILSFTPLVTLLLQI